MVRKKISFIFGLFLAINLNAERIEVTSEDFFADEKALVSDLKGNVVIKKGDYDTLNADFVKIFFDKNKQPIKYVATGNAKFKFILNEKNYDGSGEELTYEPSKQLYTLKQNAYIHEMQTDKKVYGDIITVNQLEGTYKVTSKDKKPVKFIFQIEDKK
ncbi:lipopolysaccharide transport periplasmic protein LptA [Campylobacter hyointestinalis]|uniref:Lipopolysaccharide transport periplasmic protein LptA n=1 Tax=Campylobacter hyointestinalis subsp. lawsonii TaxID=91353 RepID=A0AAV6EGF8_CAMHY|nr:lipopolysaccharide transport periplasmic protein LptA [Campylobacter hyointestinalis]ANE33975.1 putative lipooligosaccharide transport system, periplasmic component (LptA family) [Campylobacter hyointestinalis subsp. lawsonii CCUG 27631]KAB0614103.1 lipopolysaccharide transport periplasmic protein LptA [Campylobacter hyointestinalis subsp. lawsonii]QKF69840.1 lipooligosaccharide transport system, periplasmic component LptA [Campylobacter hyointestinalis subsp. lawsonii]RAZ29811.1 lipopolysac